MSRKEESPFIQKVVEIKRVSKKTEGGNRLSFNCLAVLGDGKGKVGSANCRAPDVFSAVKKATRKAQSQMISFPLVREHRTIPHRIEYKAKAAHILLKPAPAGTGLIVGGAMRAVAEAAGIKNIVGKNLGTRNKKSTVDATIKALRLLKNPGERLTGKK
ncbi:30S ribosomal protein S5 [Patescibacteria group bacterium]|nr:30S ribosomal protein S5 [Patescibacteria group bacterium]MBU1867869.1 30S ribosomal protein S5 [Patescibacteria group bacterium]